MKQIEKKLNRITHKPLTAYERGQVWIGIEARLQPRSAGFLYQLFLMPKYMIGVIVAVLLVVSGTVTVQAANNARPGDALFPLDQAIERVQYRLSSEDKRSELEVKFASERVAEVGSLLLDTSLSTESTGNVAVVAEQETTEESSQTTTNTSVLTALQLAADAVVQAQANVQATEQVRVLIDQLQQYIASLPQSTKVKIELQQHDDGVEFELEVEDHANQKIEVRDNTIRIEQLDTVDRSDRDDDGVSSESHQRGLTEAEAKIYPDGTTIVEIEFQDRKQTFTTTAQTRAAIAAEIAQQYSLDVAVVEAVLRVEFEHDEESDDSNSRDTSSSEQQANGLTEAEAKIYPDGTTIVEIEFQDRKQTFTTTAQTRAAIAAEIAQQYSLDVAVVEAVLRVEFEHDDQTSIQINTNTVTQTGGQVLNTLSTIKKIKAAVQSTGTDVKVEFLQAEDDEFFLSMTDETAIRNEIQARYGLSDADLNAVFEFKVESGR